MSVGETEVHGTEARRFTVVRLDTLSSAFEGELVIADSVAGTFTYTDKIGGVHNENLGAGAIKIVPKR